MNFYSRTLSFALVGSLLTSGWALMADDLDRPAEQTEVSGDKQRDAEPKEKPYVPKSPKELRKKLSRIQYDVTQNEATEPAFRNPYWDNKKAGVYKCIVCERELFSSRTKYKSGTGWPSFYAPLNTKNVGYKTDWNLFYSRTEVHCSRCNAHLGHVFDDGPKPTGKRYCMNSASLKFVEATKDAKKAKDD